MVKVTSAPASGREARAPAADLPPPWRLPLLVFGFLSLFGGLAAGLTRLGVGLPAGELLLLHGPLMVSGFFGTVIGLERAVAVGARPAYLGPAMSGAGGVALLGGAPLWLGALLITLGSLVLVAASALVWRRQRAVFTGTLLAGAAAWAIGNALWLAGWTVFAVVPWWAGFLVLTIAGERLELSRYRPTPVWAKRLFVVVAVLLVAALVWTTLGQGGQLLLAAALLALTAWLVRFDIARHTVRARGLTRFTAVCLLSGYAWLAAGAVLGVWYGGMFAGPAYGATLHAVFLGFVFAMVFGHAPIIFPAVTRFRVPYHPLFYLHLALLHLSLLVRLVGDLAALPEWRLVGGAANAVAIVVFILNTVAAVIRGRRSG